MMRIVQKNRKYYSDPYQEDWRERASERERERDRESENDCGLRFTVPLSEEKKKKEKAVI